MLTKGDKAMDANVVKCPLITQDKSGLWNVRVNNQSYYFVSLTEAVLCLLSQLD